MKWLFDTNVVSEGARAAPDHAVIRTLSKFPRTETGVSIVSVAELREGIESMSPSQRRSELVTWFSRGAFVLFRGSNFASYAEHPRRLALADATPQGQRQTAVIRRFTHREHRTLA